jgi:hypothetical protein
MSDFKGNTELGALYFQTFDRGLRSVMGNYQGHLASHLFSGIQVSHPQPRDHYSLSLSHHISKATAASLTLSCNYFHGPFQISFILLQ